MFCQRGRVATLVPPNFITIQGAPAESGAGAFGLTVSLSRVAGKVNPASVAPRQPECNRKFGIAFGWLNARNSAGP
ncbi:hypothetical protein GCM10007898_22180 [Dyella flagellata]|uniref:Uncharacterized protein n=1 Tax=Dyella flagellata TaxID=1867833 RepID=A0ABQ5XDB9_9GAMM|nr:hypothetical protein GCM10007898_22180 [Dyella flagellata]